MLVCLAAKWNGSALHSDVSEAQIDKFIKERKKA